MGPSHRERSLGELAGTMTLDPLEPLTGMLIIVAAHLPFMREVHLQLRLSSRLYEQLPAARRAAFPDAPKSSARLVLGSARFHVAFWAYVKRKDPMDTSAQVGLKLALRRSMKRKIIVAVLGFIVACVLVAAGWRPYAADAFPSS